MSSRRKFLTECGFIAGGLGFSYVSKGYPEMVGFNKKSGSNSGLVLRFKPYTLHLKHVFTLASGSRSTTPVMLTEIEYDNVVGYGEASMPPYLGENHDTAGRFLSMVDLTKFSNPFLTEDILNYIDQLALEIMQQKHQSILLCTT